MDEDPRTNQERIIEALKKTPGRSAKNIGKRLGLSEAPVRAVIKKMEASKEPEMRKLVAKRNAYVMGGAELVGIIKASPGAAYLKISPALKSAAEGEGVRPLDAAELFRGLIRYCKEWKDAELRETILKHKNAGGWMP